MVGYFPQWGVYEQRYLPLDLIRSGAIGMLTQLDYAQANIQNNSCVIADPQADTNLAFAAADSIDGKADAPTANPAWQPAPTSTAARALPGGAPRHLH